MKRTATRRAAVRNTFHALGKKRTNVLKIAPLPLKSNKVANLARKLADLHKSNIGSVNGFATVYKSIALQLDSDERRELHRKFTKAMMR